MVKYNSKKIDYIFKHSGFLTKTQKWNFFCICYFMLLAFGGLALFLLLKDRKEEGLGIFAACALLLLILAPITIIQLRSLSKQNKIISECMTDENLFEVTVTTWEFSAKGKFIKSYKFGIDFEMNGNSYRKISSNYSQFYENIKNKEITILYSPKYDEVMVLENERENK